MPGRAFMADGWPVSRRPENDTYKGTQRRDRSWVLTTDRPQIKSPQTHGLLRMLLFQ